LVEIYIMIGRMEDARTPFEELVSLAMHVGLRYEECDSEAELLVGNFSHIALVRAAMRLAGCP
jgi:hypothetical protein